MKDLEQQTIQESSQKTLSTILNVTLTFGKLFNGKRSAQKSDVDGTVIVLISYIQILHPSN